MKICTYCGLENSNELSNCVSCGVELPAPAPPPMIASDFKTLKIKGSDAFIQRYLEVSPKGILFCETALAGGKKKFGFHEIDSVLMSASNVLSLQVGQEVFSIQTKPNDATHQTAINRLLEEVGKTASRTTSN